MRVISLINNKGGVGKTTLAINIACELARRGAATGLIDIDPQCSAMDWGDKREERKDDNPAVVAIPAQQLAKTIQKARTAGTGAVVIDTPAKLESSLTLAAELSDMIIIPLRPSVMDLQAMKGTMACLTRIDRPKLAVLNAMSLMSRRDYPSIAETLLDTWGLSVFPTPIWDRKSYRTALFTGHGAAEIGNDKSAQEIASLVDTISELMEGRV